MCTHNLRFEQKQEKYQLFSAEFFQFLKLKNLCLLYWASFRNDITFLIQCDFIQLISSVETANKNKVDYWSCNVWHCF